MSSITNFFLLNKDAAEAKAASPPTLLHDTTKTIDVEMTKPTSTSQAEDHSMRRRLSNLFAHPSQSTEVPHATDATTPKATTTSDHPTPVEHPSLLRRLSASFMTPIPSGGLPYTTEMAAADNEANFTRPAAEAQAAQEHESFLRRLSHTHAHAHAHAHPASEPLDSHPTPAVLPSAVDETNPANERLGFLKHVESTHTSHIPVDNAEHKVEHPSLLRRLSSTFSSSSGGRRSSMADSGPFVAEVDPQTGHAVARKNPHWPYEDSWKTEKAMGTKGADGYVVAPGLNA